MDAFTDPMKRLKGGPFLQLLVDHYTDLQEGEEVMLVRDGSYIDVETRNDWL